MTTSNMSDGYFVTGTDTGVGKTVVSAALLQQLCEYGRSVMYMKPVQTGCPPTGNAPDPDTCFRLAGITPTADDLPDICPYRLQLPASPHLAAAREQVTISLDRIVASFHRFRGRHDLVVVEGAGGVLVPLYDRTTMLDLMQRLAIPVVVACRSGLGTLNHTLLTLRALRDAGLTVTGLVMVQTTEDPWGEIEEDNRSTLERLGEVRVLSRIDYHPALADGTAGPDVLAACTHGRIATN